MNKQELRKLYLQKRRDLSAEDTAVFTSAIIAAFSRLKFGNVEYLHLFYPIVGKSEFDTLRLANYIRDEYPAIKLVLSKSNFADHSLQHYIWTEKTPLAINNYGITEPQSGELVHPKQIDMILIPLLAFDKSGYRVGYGKGFYDRFLSECRPNSMKTGLSFFEPIEKIDDINPHDIPLNICITPGKIWEF